MNELTFDLFIPQLKTHFELRVDTANGISVDSKENFTMSRVEYKSFRSFFKKNPETGEWMGLDSYEAMDYSINAPRRMYRETIQNVYAYRADYSVGYKDVTYDQKNKIYKLVKEAVNAFVKANPQAMRSARLRDEEREKKSKLAQIERKKIEIEALYKEIAAIEAELKAS